MATQKIKCRACGFGALLFTTGETTKLIVDSAKQIHLCKYLIQQPRSSTRKGGALDCRDFREAVQRPGKNDVSGSPTLDETENEAVAANAAVPEKATIENLARSRRSRPCKGAETDAGSPKAKSARRPPKKRTRPRKIHSDVAIVAEGEPRECLTVAETANPDAGSSLVRRKPAEVTSEGPPNGLALVSSI